MLNATEIFTPQWTAEAFPPERAIEFFEALYGDPEDAAYNIEFAFVQADGLKLQFTFNLHQRAEQCLACNLTYGLPGVFLRHPIINARGLAEKIAAVAGKKLIKWQFGQTMEFSQALHAIPFEVWLE